MDTQIFLDHFERLTDAPNAVARLRELVLQLAVQGRLVEQDERDEPAVRLLERIEAERKRLVREKKIREAKPLPPVMDDEKPFEIPDNWRWVRLGELGDWGAGATPDRKNPDYYGGSTFWFKSGELNDGYISESEETITDLALQKCSLRLNQPGDVLIAMYGATIGKVAILEREATTNQAVCACTCFGGAYNRFLFLLLKAYKSRFTNQGAGGAQPNISKEKIIHTVAPLPPLEEQKRIVAKVDELMRLCDELEQAQDAKREARRRLNRATLDGLLAARDTAEFQARWQTVSEHFPTLTAAPDQISKLRQTVLQLAVQGRLATQDPNDEPASLLLKKIRREKERLIKERKIKEPKEDGFINEADFPISIPGNWALSRVVDLCFVTKLAGFEFTKYIKLTDTGDVPVVRAQNVKRNKLDETNLKYIDVKTSTLLERCALTKEAILMTFIGNVGDVAIFNKKERWHLAPNVAKLEPFNEYEKKIDTNYLLYYLMSDLGKSEILQYSKATAQASLSMGTIRQVIVALPPLEEQKRIVAVVNRLMALCNELEAGLRRAAEDGERLLRMAVRALLAPALKDEDEQSAELVA